MRELIDRSVIQEIQTTHAPEKTGADYSCNIAMLISAGKADPESLWGRIQRVPHGALRITPDVETRIASGHYKKIHSVVQCLTFTKGFLAPSPPNVIYEIAVTVGHDFLPGGVFGEIHENEKGAREALNFYIGLMNGPTVISNRKEEK